MKTLTSERLRLAPEVIDTREARFWNEYGSYRVVEGVLCVGASEGSVWIRENPQDTPNFHVGERGDHVKLILPPEEKEGDSLNRKLLQAQSDKRDAQHRADRYEKALRHIAMNAEYAQEPAVPLEVGGNKRAWRLAGTIARGALDDTEC